MSADVQDRIAGFLEDLTRAMGLTLRATARESDGGFRLDLEGEGGEVLLRQRAEALNAVQHIVNTAFRRQLGEDRRVLIDCQHYRRDKDIELREMAKFLVEKARRTGMSQEIGPLNAYERRIVHMVVAEQNATSESIGDAAVKTVIISVP